LVCHRLGYFCCCHCCRYWNSVMTFHLRRLTDSGAVLRRARTCGRGRPARGMTAMNFSIVDSWFCLVESFLSVCNHSIHFFFMKRQIMIECEWMNRNVSLCPLWVIKMSPVKLLQSESEDLVYWIWQCVPVLLFVSFTSFSGL